MLLFEFTWTIFLINLAVVFLFTFILLSIWSLRSKNRKRKNKGKHTKAEEYVRKAIKNPTPPSLTSFSFRPSQRIKLLQDIKNRPLPFRMSACIQYYLKKGSQ